jgi:antirestriction protein ArdC
MRQFSVFNVQQCEGLPQNEPPPELPEHERNERAEAFLPEGRGALGGA